MNEWFRGTWDKEIFIDEMQFDLISHEGWKGFSGDVISLYLLIPLLE